MRNRINDILGKRGYELRRHPAVRRQQMFEAHGVDLVFDVGAAKGAYVQQLREFGYSGRAVSFEPLSGAFGALAAASASDSNWAALQYGLGAETGQATINVASNSDSSSLLPMLDAHRDAAPHVGYVGTETIKLVRLDDVAAPYLAEASVPFLKIDAQGFERQILNGARETIDMLAGLQLELSFVELYSGSETANQAMSWAYDTGFVLVGFEPGLIGAAGQLLQGDGVFFRV